MFVKGIAVTWWALIGSSGTTFASTLKVSSPTNPDYDDVRNDDILEGGIPETLSQERISDTGGASGDSTRIDSHYVIDNNDTRNSSVERVLTVFGQTCDPTAQTPCPNGSYCDPGNNKCAAKLKDGDPCDTNDVCEGYCDVSGTGKCVSCTNSGQCDSNKDEFCDLVTPNLVGRCRKRFPIGSWCSADDFCDSGHCDWVSSKCKACTDDIHCGFLTGTMMFCDLQTEGFKETCREKFNNGSWCNNHAMCKGFCHADSCLSCAKDTDCGDDRQFCDTTTPGMEGHCRAKLPPGSSCANENNDSCQGYCDQNSSICHRCSEDSQCPSGEFCDLVTDLHLNHCRPRFPNTGWCISNSMCSSGYCDIDKLECSPCSDTDQCSDGKYCDVVTTSADHLYTCRNTNPNTGWCASYDMCMSGYCDSSTCQPCYSDSNCQDDAFCDLVSPEYFNQCRKKFGNDVACSSSDQCQSNFCDPSTSTCKPCSGQCGDGQFCDTTTEGFMYQCRAKHQNDAYCASSDWCHSGYCDLNTATCAPCSHDGHCENDTEFCDTQTTGYVGKCRLKFKENQWCDGVDDVCEGYCDLANSKCVPCRSSGQCNEDEYCDTLTPGWMNRCRTKHPGDGWCTNHGVCVSGLCDMTTLTCQPCFDDDQCGSPLRFCDLTTPHYVNHCREKRLNGGFCDRNGECLTRYCDTSNNQCGICTQDDQCDDDSFCDLDDGNFKNLCRKRFGNGGWCSSDKYCIGHCNTQLAKCEACARSEQCGMDGKRFCDTQTPGSFRNTCREKFDDGIWCNAAEICKSGFCDMTEYKCKACSAHNHCQDLEFCDTISPGLEGTCQPKRREGFWCPDWLADDGSWCLSGECSGEKCLECSQHSHCGYDEYCENQTCHQKKLGGESCGGDAICLSGRCLKHTTQTCEAEVHFWTKVWLSAELLQDSYHLSEANVKIDNSNVKFDEAQYYIYDTDKDTAIVTQRDNVVYVAFRGTYFEPGSKELSNDLAQFRFNDIVSLDPENEENCQFHVGLYQGYKAIKELKGSTNRDDEVEINDRIEMMMNDPSCNRGGSNNCKLIISGHSAGSGQALPLAIDQSRHNPDVYLLGGVPVMASSCSKIPDNKIHTFMIYDNFFVDPFPFYNLQEDSHGGAPVLGSFEVRGQGYAMTKETQYNSVMRKQDFNDFGNLDQFRVVVHQGDLSLVNMGVTGGRRVEQSENDVTMSVPSTTSATTLSANNLRGAFRKQHRQLVLPLLIAWLVNEIVFVTKGLQAKAVHEIKEYLRVVKGKHEYYQDDRNDPNGELMLMRGIEKGGRCINGYTVDGGWHHAHVLCEDGNCKQQTSPGASWSKSNCA